MHLKNHLPLPLGRVVITRNALGSLDPEDVLACLIRHKNGDWGECGKEDWKENDSSVWQGYRILSSYKDRNRNRFWIITEADRSATTVLLPEDY